MDEKFLHSLFSATGRMRPMAYFLRLLFWFALVGVITAATLPMALSETKDAAADGLSTLAKFSLMSLLFGVFLAAGISRICMTVRRFHDAGTSGWWTLALFVPIIGFIAQIAALVMPGTPGPNQYGPDPLASKTPLMDAPSPLIK